MDIVELLIGIAEIATALAGFSGVVVAFGSRSLGTWSPGDRLRLTFLLEASLTGGGCVTGAACCFPERRKWLELGYSEQFVGDRRLVFIASQSDENTQ